jgi:hypothetical protein
VRDTLLWQRLPWKRLQPQPIRPSATQIALLEELIKPASKPAHHFCCSTARSSTVLDRCFYVWIQLHLHAKRR